MFFSYHTRRMKIFPKKVLNKLYKIPIRNFNEKGRLVELKMVIVFVSGSCVYIYGIVAANPLTIP